MVPLHEERDLTRRSYFASDIGSIAGCQGLTKGWRTVLGSGHIPYRDRRRYLCMHEAMSIRSGPRPNPMGITRHRGPTLALGPGSAMPTPQPGHCGWWVAPGWPQLPPAGPHDLVELPALASDCLAAQMIVRACPQAPACCCVCVREYLMHQHCDHSRDEGR